MNETELIDYVQQAFHMEDEKHKQLLDIATMKEVVHHSLDMDLEFSTLIGRGPTRLCSNWLDLDHSVAMPAILCHKDKGFGPK